MFRPGATLRGTVAGQQNGQFFLQLGDQMLKADSRVPLRIGDTISLRVQGENKGQINLQLVSTPLTKMSMADLSQTLTNLKMPVDQGNLNLAKTMVELKIPLTKENFAQMKQVLAQVAGPNNQAQAMPAKVAATSFLQNSQLPVTPQNVNVLSNFIANNPQAGMQMMSLNTELKKLSDNTNGVTKEMTQMISGIEGKVKGLMMEPKNRHAGKTNPKNMKRMAKQNGIEFNLGPAGAGGGEEWDFPEMLRRMRERLNKDGMGSKELLALMKGLEENLEAQKLINAAKSESNLGYYYLQLPLMGDYNAELWLEYNEDGDGNRTVSMEDTRIEFLVTTEHMGELHFLVDIRKGKCYVDLGTPSQDVRRFATRYLPALAETVKALGWTPGRFRCVYRPHGGRRELVERTDFDELERCDVQA